MRRHGRRDASRMMIMSIDRKALSEQHIALEESAAQLQRAVATEVPDLEALARAKWQFGYRLALHLAHEDRHVYPALKAHVDPAIARLASRYEHEMGDLDQRFRHYIAQWSSNRIISEWPKFVQETRALLAGLAQRIRCEEHELYPLIDR
ncbi:hemerythrin domain-containing protein [Sphingomonas echinoides]|uniref:hemerythrin domain-containing protein n=1 Tax=Sphingomonas echinoides TaxID=59803 RepID=UPI0032215566